ncbi:DUF4307 domain-containing protein [Arthrobacter sp. TmT3-37]|uniref:DUF4307 domain-containing protein n=1 Tax=Arthrobacter sp. B1805 TaxID=2058892 RepID=UPI000CE4D1D5|nr:DUF4307 domain-containing protein [Arthrobacter sp. B1805]
MSESTAAQRGTATTRYGRSRARLSRRTKLVLLAILLALAVIAAGFLSMTNTEPVSSKDVGFNVEQNGFASVDFEVIKDPGATAQCAIQALSENYAVVGWKIVDISPNTVDVGADQGRSTAHRVQLRVDSPAVSGGVNSCWLVEDS